MQYILSEEEIREFHALQLENEELRTELTKQASCAYESHKALKAKELECNMLYASLDRSNKVAHELRRDILGTEAELQKARAELAHTNLVLEGTEAELLSTKKNLVAPKGSDFDLDKFRVVGHLNEDGSITLFNK